jgi:hypothetical protein
MSLPDQSPFVYGLLGYDSPEEKAQKINAASADRYNAMLRDLFHESRGSTGHALYSEALGGAEREFGNTAVGQARALRDYYGTPQDILARGAGVAARYQPLLEAGTKSIYGIYSGDEEAKRMAAAAPTFAARRGLAETTATGAMKGISDRLNAIRAQNAASGFVGAGSGSERLGFQAQIEGNQQAGGARGAAELANASEAQAIRNQILDQQLRGSELAGSLAGADLRFQTLPAEVVAAISQAQLGPLAPFRLGPGGTPQQTMAPWATPEPGLGQILDSLGGSGSQIGRYFLQRDLANRYGRGGGGGANAWGNPDYSGGYSNSYRSGGGTPDYYGPPAPTYEDTGYGGYTGEY